MTIIFTTDSEIKTTIWTTATKTRIFGRNTGNKVTGISTIKWQSSTRRRVIICINKKRREINTNK